MQNDFKKGFFLAEDVYPSPFNFLHVGFDNVDWDNVDCDGVVNCPTQPTCIAHFDLCISQLFFLTNPQ